MPEEEIELADAIANLRGQLQAAIKEGDGKDLRFEVKDIDVELKCCVKKAAEVNGGVKFWVINAGGKGTVSNEFVQTVKLKLGPVREDGGNVLLSGVDKDVK